MGQFTRVTERYSQYQVPANQYVPPATPHAQAISQEEVVVSLQIHLALAGCSWTSVSPTIKRKVYVLVLRVYVPPRASDVRNSIATPLAPVNNHLFVLVYTDVASKQWSQISKKLATLFLGGQSPAEVSKRKDKSSTNNSVVLFQTHHKMNCEGFYRLGLMDSVLYTEEFKHIIKNKKALPNS